MRYRVAGMGVLALAAISMVTAAWPGIGSSAGQAAPFTVRSASSQIDVGDAGTVPLFDLSNVEPGESGVGCFRVRIDAGSHGSDGVRLYSSGLPEIEGARSVGIHISSGDPIAGSDAAPGVIDCDELEGPLTQLTLRDGSVADYASTRFAYTIGDPLGLVGPGINTVVVRIALVFPDADAAAGAKTLDTGWVIEAH
jgi:hypothetical protein